MSFQTRSNGYDWQLKLLAVTGCTACTTAGADILRATTIVSCTVVGGFDTIGGLSAKLLRSETTAFGDGMTLSTIGSGDYGPVTGSGVHDPQETTLYNLLDDIFHLIDL